MTVYKWLVLQTADGEYHRERRAHTGKCHDAYQLLQFLVPTSLAIKVFSSTTQAKSCSINLLEKEDSVFNVFTWWPLLTDQRAQHNHWSEKMERAFRKLIIKGNSEYGILMFRSTSAVDSWFIMGLISSHQKTKTT